MKTSHKSLFLVLTTFLAVTVAGTCLLASPKPLAEPAKIDISVEPKAVAAGEQARVTVQLEPVPGVQINRYPKIKLSVNGQQGLVDDGEVAMGNSAPPPPDQMEKNYFETVEPLELDLQVDGGAPHGSHSVPAKLTYFYCVKASGFCAPKKVAIEIPLNIL